MRVLFLGFSKIKYMPYFYHYYDVLCDVPNIKVGLVYWNRDLKSDSKIEPNIDLFEFKKEHLESFSAIKKVSNFIKFRRYAKRVIKSQKPSLIIILHSMPGVLLKSFLFKNYRNRFIYDYRDITYEKRWFYRRIVNSLVKYSSMTFVSSPMFLEVFDQKLRSKPLVTHNTRLLELKKENNWIRKSCSKPIVISFWGIIRHEEINLFLIRALKNDARFLLQFYGPKNDCSVSLEEEVRRDGINNVVFLGPYNPSDKDNIVLQTDIVHNAYSSDDKNMNKAVSNKFYDAIISKKPQLCIAGSFMASVVEKYDIGIIVDLKNEKIGDTIFNEFYRLHESTSFKSNCACLVSKIEKDMLKNRRLIMELVNDIESNE